MTSKIGYNCLHIPDKGAFLIHLQTFQPPAILFYQNELDFARQVKAQFPNMVVLLRNWPDSNIHKEMTPAQWMDQHAPQAAGGLMLYTTNEPEFSDDLIRWTEVLMQMAIVEKIPLCVLNLAHGTWQQSDMPRLKNIFMMASQHRELFVIGWHEYSGGVITSGLAGGYPNNAGKLPGTPGGFNLIPIENWPSPDAAKKLTRFHIGRHSWAVDYCLASNIPLPRFADTETGFDFTSDIAGFLNALPKPAGISSINGWRTLTAAWAQPQWFASYSPDAMYVKQFEWAEKALMFDLEFALLFASGDDGNWPMYNVANSGIPALLERSPKATQEVPAITPSPALSVSIPVQAQTPPVVTAPVIPPPVPQTPINPIPVPSTAPYSFILPGNTIIIETTDAQQAKLAGDYMEKMMLQTLEFLKSVSVFKNVSFGLATAEGEPAG